MQSLLNYQSYTYEELIAIIVRSKVYFSRRHSYSLANFEPPMTISVQQDRQGAGQNELQVIASCHNNCDNVTEILRHNEFISSTDIGAGWYKKWILGISKRGSSVTILKQLLDSIENAVDSMPFALYESNQYKIIRDFYQFLKSPTEKISYAELIEFLGYTPGQYRARLEFITQNTAFMIAKYKRDNWAAWIEGDTLIPIFLSEQQAVTFLQSRNAILYPREKIRVKSIQAVPKRWNQGVYILTDSSKTVPERIAWLHEELSILQKGIPLKEGRVI